MTPQAKSFEFRERLAAAYGEGIMFMFEPEMDAAVIGVSHDGQVTYDGMKVIEILMDREGLDSLDAHEFFDFNIAGAKGEGYPIFIWVDPDRMDARSADSVGLEYWPCHRIVGHTATREIQTS